MSHRGLAKSEHIFSHRKNTSNVEIVVNAQQCLCDKRERERIRIETK